MPLVAGCARGVAAAARSVGSAGCQHAEWVVRVCELKWVQPPPPPGAARGGARKPSGGCRHRGARRARPRACCPLPRSCRECCKPVGARASQGCEFAPSGRQWRIGRPPPLGLETGPPPAPLRTGCVSHARLRQRLRFDLGPAFRIASAAAWHGCSLRPPRELCRRRVRRALAQQRMLHCGRH